jgi:hypothetical protein
MTKTFRTAGFAAKTAFGLIALMAVAGTAVAQHNGNDRKQEQKISSQQRKIDRQNAKIEQMRIRAEQQRQLEWARRNNRMGSTRVVGTGYYTLEPVGSIGNGRYRVNRGGRWYNTDNRGVELLRQAVNEGYRQGFEAGRNDLQNRRRADWSHSNVYRTGTHGYQTGVERGQYQYYFRQGFERGYQDGSNAQYQNNYNGSYQYGMDNGGSLNILGTILNQILNVQSY